MPSAHPRDASDANQSVNERRQLPTNRQRERRRLMSQQREATLSRRRTNYQSRRRGVTQAYQHDSTMDTTNVATGTHSIHMRQTCNLQPIPTYVLPSAFEHGSASTNQNIMHHSTTSPNNAEGQCLNSFVDFSDNHANHVHLVNVDATTRCTQISSIILSSLGDINQGRTQVDAIAENQRNELWLNARLHMPVRTKIIGLGWKITLEMKTYDFGRVILRIFRKLQRHTAKRIGWIEGWDLTKKWPPPLRLNSQNNLISINVAAQTPLKLTATNYLSWKLQFHTLFIGYDLLGYIDGSKPCPPMTCGRRLS